MTRASLVRSYMRTQLGRPVQYVAVSCNPLVSGLVEVRFPNHLVEVPVDPEDPAKGTQLELDALYPAAGQGLPLQWQTNRTLALNADTQLTGPTAGRFTGTLRGLVQDMLGRGQVVEFSALWALSHGIYTTTQGYPWAIEISGSGVRAAPLRLCVPTPDPAVLTFATASTGMPSGSTVRELISGDLMTPFYGELSSLYPECSWAFSGSGGRASNTGWRWNGAFKEFARFTITITEGEDPNEPGRMIPISATLNEDARGYFWGPRHMHLKVPHYGAPQDSLISFDSWYSQFDPPADTFSCPIYCWYEGEQLRTVDYLFSRSATTEDGLSGYSWQQGFSSPIYGDVPTGFFGGSGNYERWEKRQVFSNYMFAAQAISETFEEYWAYDPSVESYIVADYTDRTRSYGDLLAIPFNDRESIYHGRSDWEVDQGTWQSDDSRFESSLRGWAGYAGFGGWPEIQRCASLHGHPFPDLNDEGRVAWEPPLPGTQVTTTGGTWYRYEIDPWSNMWTGEDLQPCEQVGVGGSLLAAADAQLQKNIQYLGWPEGTAYESHDHRWPPSVWPGRTRKFQESYTVTYKEPDPGQGTYTANIRIMSYAAIDPVPAPVDLNDYRWPQEPVDDQRYANEQWSLYGNGSQRSIAMTKALWDELTVYDEDPAGIARILWSTPDYHEQQYVYSKTLWPWGGAVGATLTGIGPYPYAGLSFTRFQYVGNP